MLPQLRLMPLQGPSFGATMDAAFRLPELAAGANDAAAVAWQGATAAYDACAARADQLVLLALVAALALAWQRRALFRALPQTAIDVALYLWVVYACFPAPACVYPVCDT